MARTQVLCVDDEPHVIDGIADTLRRDCDVVRATSGVKALELLATKHIDVMLSDMRMPGMDGAAVLTRAREVKPDVPRILLTGQADLDSAIVAVNSGQLFRFLTKPCSAEQLRATIAAALEQHRLVTAERELLEKTLHGSVAALVDLLAMTNPVAFGRASRIKARVSTLAAALALPVRWQVEMAAMLQPIAYVTLPHDTVERMLAGHQLSADEKRMIARLPSVTEQLLGHIPRLEEVRAILAGAGHPSTRDNSLVDIGAALLRVAGDLEDLEMQGTPAPEAAEIVHGRAGMYPARVSDAVRRLASTDAPRTEIHEIPLAALRVGMVFADDVKMTTGTLLVARGYVVTAGFLARVRNFPEGALRGPLRITVETAAS